jgi:hypothetical protein
MTTTKKNSEQKSSFGLKLTRVIVVFIWGWGGVRRQVKQFIKKKNFFMVTIKISNFF